MDAFHFPAEYSGGLIPPQAIEVEKSVLGAILLQQDALVKVIDLLKPEYFYDPRHKVIYETMIELFHESAPIDLLTVTESLRKKEKLNEIGGPAYLASLTISVASAANIEFHARIVVEKYLKRELIHFGQKTIQKAFQEREDVFDLLEETEKDLFRLSENHLRRQVLPVRDVLGRTIQRLEEIRKKDSHYTGIPSGFHDLDRITSGWQPSDLIIIAARPSMGKTAFALSIARYAAVVNQIPTVFFSLEMSAMQLVTRLLCAEANLDSRRVQNADLSPEEWELLLRASRVLAQAPLFIDDTAALSIYELRAKARRLRAEKRIELVIVDYLQLMRGMVSKNINREQEVATISRSLKELAKELEIPVIALAQLNRAVETRQNKKPLLSDLRESGSIEQDADLILFIDRPERYGVLTYEDGTPTEGMATVIIGKHRNGPTGEVRLRFVKEYGKFLNETDVAPTPPSEITAFYPTHQNYSEISIPSRASEILSASLEEEDTTDSDEEDFFPF